ncbi:MAG: amidophosphoribosyltransferase [Dehalococcoidales bacterium]|nr:amidophosphoribosyltransferase [Dehalococcoidales bacterium]
MHEDLHESCAVTGIYAPGEDVARLTFFSIFTLQHRGQESAGIATSDGESIRFHGEMGLVSQVFDEDSLRLLTGHIAIGHTRYSTTGSSKLYNCQPIIVGEGENTIAVAHNGNIINGNALQDSLVELGYTFHTSTDTEIIANLILSAPYEKWVDKIRYAMRRLQGAYSLTIMTANELYAVRDPLGVRPLCLGNLNGNGYVVASETCALDNIGAQFIKEIDPNEIIMIDSQGMHEYPEGSGKSGMCVFEFIYFARLDSTIYDRLLYQARYSMGAAMAEEHPVEADLVVGVPDSALAAAAGYAYQSGIPLAEGLVKNRYVGRTFIEPDQRLRDRGAKLKYNPLPRVLDGKRVIVVDDSIVRGTTTPQVIKILRKAGAKEVHMRICAPPIKFPCFLGVDMATRAELIAAQKTIPEICEFIGADSLGYLSVEGLVKSIDLPRSTFCLACFTGDYPIPVQFELDKLAFESSVSTDTEL